MPRQRNWADLKPATRRRYERFFGLNARFQYESGANLQAARGHKPREHIIRRERIAERIARGLPAPLSAADRAFLAMQRRRVIEEDAFETNQEFLGDGDTDNEPVFFDPWQSFVEFYRGLSPSNRALVRSRVHMEIHEYKKRHSTPKQRTIGEYTNELMTAYPFFNEAFIAIFYYH